MGGSLTQRAVRLPMKADTLHRRYRAMAAQ
jgi:hypothetical protein